MIVRLPVFSIARIRVACDNDIIPRTNLFVRPFLAIMFYKYIVYDASCAVCEWKVKKGNIFYPALTINIWYSIIFFTSLLK